VLGTVLGALVMQVIATSFNMLLLPYALSLVLKAAIILVAVYLQRPAGRDERLAAPPRPAARGRRPPCARAPPPSSSARARSSRSRPCARSARRATPSSRRPRTC
jgi:hypothetical protein